ncbi:MAG: SdpI family protein [Clostridia bacterium]|nr:SdpI family protein [Clostridia bacterium]NCC75138.1 SdpI family protein [Clostridia bacterium]
MSQSMKTFLRQEWPLLLVILAPLVAAIVIYPAMPDIVPTHWNAQGEVDGTSSRGFGTFFLPLMNIGLYVLLLFSPKLDPKRENYAGFAGTYRLIRWLIHAFMVVIFGVTIAAALGYEVDIGLLVPASVAVMFIILGATMSRVKFNYFVGIRVPWTLADEEVWNQTHKVASKWMMAGGTLALLGSVLLPGDLRYTVFMICILAPVLAATVYSYVIFQRKRRDS